MRIDGTGLGGIRARKVLKVKAFFGELLTGSETFPTGIQFQQNVMVSGQDAVDFPDHVDLLVGLLVVIAIAARVAAELLVHAANDGFTAVEAFSLFVHLFIYLVDAGC